MQRVVCYVMHSSRRAFTLEKTTADSKLGTVRSRMETRLHLAMRRRVRDMILFIESCQMRSFDNLIHGHLPVMGLGTCERLSKNAVACCPNHISTRLKTAKTLVLQSMPDHLVTQGEAACYRALHSSPSKLSAGTEVRVLRKPALEPALGACLCARRPAPAAK